MKCSGSHFHVIGLLDDTALFRLVLGKEEITAAQLEHALRVEDIVQPGAGVFGSGDHGQLLRYGQAFKLGLMPDLLNKGPGGIDADLEHIVGIRQRVRGRQ